MQIGTSHLLNNRYPEAMGELLTAVQLDPRNPQIQNNLALAYFARGRYVESEQHFRRALEIDPRFTEARNNLGRLLMEGQRMDEAVEHFVTAVNDLTFPRPAESLLNLGEAYFRQKDYQNARTQLEKSVQINRDSCPAQLFFGKTLYELGEFNLAGKALDAAIRLCSSLESDKPHFYSALSYAKMGDRSRAIARLEEMVSLYPEGSHRVQAEQMLDLLK